MTEELDTSAPGFRPEYARKALRAAEAARLLAAGEVVDEPSVEVPEGFNLGQVVRLPDPTPELIEKSRRKFDVDDAEERHMYRYSAPLQTRVGDTSINDGGGRRRHRE